MSRIAKRMQQIAPFHVMELMAVAKKLEEQGRHVIHMEVGEPDFSTAEPITRAAIQSLQKGETSYTLALGLKLLREKIAQHYQQSYGVEINPQRVMLTPGASGAFQLAIWSSIDPGDEVLMADPGYPCNRHFVRLAGGVPVCVPTSPETNWQLTPESIKKNITPKTKAVMIGSPANPTGSIVTRAQLAEITDLLKERDLLLISDEVYHGLIYDGDTTCALVFDDQAFVLNSFSKYFGMTGWRLGWAIVPEPSLRAAETLAQNLFIAPPTMAQHGALVAFEPATLKILDQRREEFRHRRDYLYDALREIGFSIPVKPEGAFYLYAGVQKFTSDSFQFALDLAENTAVTLTPGLDFGPATAKQYVRIAYTTSLPNLQEGVRRMREWLG